MINKARLGTTAAAMILEFSSSTPPGKSTVTVVAVGEAVGAAVVVVKADIVDFRVEIVVSVAVTTVVETDDVDFGAITVVVEADIVDSEVVPVVVETADVDSEVAAGSAVVVAGATTVTDGTRP